MKNAPKPGSFTSAELNAALDKYEMNWAVEDLVDVCHGSPLFMLFLRSSFGDLGIPEDQLAIYAMNLSFVLELGWQLGVSSAFPPAEVIN